MKIPTLKKLQDKTNRKLDELAEDIEKLFASDMSGEDFERLKERIYKTANKTEPDVKFLNLLKKSKE